MLANDPPAGASSRLILLSLLDATLPVLYSVIAPHAIENLCIEPRSGRVFAARSLSAAAAAAAGGPAAGPPSTGAGAGGTAAARAAAAGVTWGVPSMSESKGSSGSGEAEVAGAATWSGSSATAIAAVSSGESWMAGGGEAGEGAVSVLALASGSFLDRGPSRSVGWGWVYEVQYGFGDRSAVELLAVISVWKLFLLPMSSCFVFDAERSFWVLL